MEIVKEGQGSVQHTTPIHIEGQATIFEKCE